MQPVITTRMIQVILKNNNVITTDLNYFINIFLGCNTEAMEVTLDTPEHKTAHFIV
jgi:hypothetical protein